MIYIIWKLPTHRYFLVGKMKELEFENKISAILYPIFYLPWFNFGIGNQKVVIVF